MSISDQIKAVRQLTGQAEEAACNGDFDQVAAARDSCLSPHMAIGLSSTDQLMRICTALCRH